MTTEPTYPMPEHLRAYPGGVWNEALAGGTRYTQTVQVQRLTALLTRVTDDLENLVDRTFDPPGPRGRWCSPSEGVEYDEKLALIKEAREVLNATEA